MEIVLGRPRGFCAGVDRAIEIVELALERYGAPIFVRHEIVHNRHVVEDLRARGAVFVEEPKEVPSGSVLIFSAHGVAPAVREAAAARKLRVIDATCPLVTKVHVETLRMAREGLEIVLVGHAGHVEVEGTLGHAPGRMHLVQTVADAEALQVEDPERLGCVTQTTLSVDDTRDILDVLTRRFPGIRLPRKDDICYATQNRQNAVKELTLDTQLVIVVGSPSSSNSNRLVDLARQRGARAHLVQSADEIDPAWLEGAEGVGVTAGASAPEWLVEETLQRLQSMGGPRTSVRELAAEPEGVVFQVPPELR